MNGTKVWRIGAIVYALTSFIGCAHHGGGAFTARSDSDSATEPGLETGGLVEDEEGEMIEEWVTIPVRLVYGPGEADPDEQARAALQELQESVGERGDVVRVAVDGHADSSEGSGDAEEVGRERAEEAVDYLVDDLGMPREMFEVHSHGDSRPMTSETTSADRAQNRRLEFRVLVRRRRGPTAMPAYRPVYSPPSPAHRPSPRSPAAMPYRSHDGEGGGVSNGPVQVVTYEHLTDSGVPQLTAAAVGDTDRRGPYLSYLERWQNLRSNTDLDMTRRVRVRVLDSRSRPVHDASIALEIGGARVQGRTHADGYWDFYPGVVSPAARGQIRADVQWRNQSAGALIELPARGDGRDVVIQLPGATSTTPSTLDLAFAIDATGSMGDEFRYVSAEILGIVDRIRRSVGQVNVRVGAVFYRDRNDSELLHRIPFTSDIASFRRHMSRIRADGGGDYPEDMNSGLAATMTQLQWTSGPAVRVMVLIADAPPQRYPDAQYTYHHAMVDASRRGIRILPVAASGADQVVQYLFRAMGAYTSTPFVYLTDDSGIGNHHMEADTDRVTVEMFSHLLTRLLISDLQGLGMHEGSHAPQEQLLGAAVR